MSWVLVQCSEHWKGNALTGPILFSIRLTKKDKGAYDELVETIYQRTGVSKDQIQLKLTSHVETGVDKVTLTVMSDDDVEFVIMHKETGWATIDVEFVNKHEFRPPPNPIQSNQNVWSLLLNPPIFYGLRGVLLTINQLVAAIIRLLHSNLCQ